MKAVMLLIATVALALLAAGMVRAGAPEYRVGSGCTYATIQAAVDAIPDQGTGIIRIRAGTYVEALQINNRTVELLGGHADCTTANATGLTRIDASGNTDPVIYYEVNVGPAGTSHALFTDRLVLFNGTASTVNSGGGISVYTATDLTATVTLARTFVRDNQATHVGGGIALRGAGNGLLSLQQNTHIQGNTVTSSTPYGGGLYCRGEYEILMLGGSIHSNTAGEEGDSNARGGGIYLDGCDMDWFANSQLAASDDAALRHNTVYGDGGGLYATGGTQVNLTGAHIVFAGGDEASSRPLRIHGNQALIAPGFGSGRGGAIFVASAFGASRVGVDRAWVYHNHADSSGGAFVVGGGTAELIVERGSETCHTPRRCSRVFDNTAASHSVVNVLFGDATFSRTIVSGNISSAPSTDIMRVQTGGTLVIADSLVHGNEADIGFHAAPPSTAAAGADLRIHRSTVAANAFANSVAQFGNDNSYISIYDTIIHEPGTTMAAISEDPFIEISCVVWHDDQLGGFRTQVADPMFLDPAAGLFYLQPGSPAINFCDIPPPAPGVDLDWNPRGILHSDQPAVYGPYDLGAYEFPLEIFSDRFESP